MEVSLLPFLAAYVDLGGGRGDNFLSVSFLPGIEKPEYEISYYMGF